jgi:hypothetical protein
MIEETIAYVSIMRQILFAITHFATTTKNRLEQAFHRANKSGLSFNSSSFTRAS